MKTAALGLLALEARWWPLRSHSPRSPLDGPLYIGSQRMPVQVRATAAYEQYDDDHGKLSQLTLPLVVTLPLARNLGLTIHTQYVSAEGDSLAGIDGLADTQLGLSYYRALGAGSAVVTLGVNVPSGQRAFWSKRPRQRFS